MSRLNSLRRKYAQCKYLGGKCAVTSESIEDHISRWGCLRHWDFHHINDATKSESYKRLIRGNCNAKVISELDKCRPLLNMYHQIIEGQHIRGSFTDNKGITIPITSGMIDFSGKSDVIGHFFSDVRLDTYSVKTDEVDKICSVTETQSIVKKCVQEINNVKVVNQSGVVILYVENDVLHIDPEWNLGPWEFNCSNPKKRLTFNRGMLLDQSWNILHESCWVEIRQLSTMPKLN